MISFCLIINACRSEEQIRYEQYVIAGKNLYETHCANCHGKNGEGLRNLYPGLNGSARLGETAYLTCLIRYGTSGKEPNMPANSQLYALDVAQIITFLNERWGDGSMTETEEVEKVKCGEMDN